MVFETTDCYVKFENSVLQLMKKHMIEGTSIVLRVVREARLHVVNDGAGSCIPYLLPTNYKPYSGRI